MADLNLRDYIDVTFSDVGDGLDLATIDGDELVISGAGVGTAVLDGTAVLQSGTTYRYAFTGDFVGGVVTVEFAAATFQDLAGNANATETESFTVTLGDGLTPGAEQIVNSYVPGNQQLLRSTGAVAVAPAGDFVIAFQGRGADDAQSVFVRRFNADGTPVADAFRVNETIAGPQQAATVALAPDGSMLVAWEGQGNGDTRGIFARWYDANGTPGPEFRVNQTTDGVQLRPDVAIGPAGETVIVWTGFGDDDPSNYGTFMSRWLPDGTLVDDEVLVNTTTLGIQDWPAVAFAPDGRFTVAWSGVGVGGETDGVFLQQFNADGTRNGTELRVNTTTVGPQRKPDLAYNVDGQLAVVWEGYAPGDGVGIVLQRYGADAAPVGTEQLVNTTTGSTQNSPAIAAAGDGTWVVTWSSPKQDGSDRGVYAQQVDATGQPIGGELLVNTTTQGLQDFPAVGGDGNGNYVIAWRGEGVGDNSGVFVSQLLNEPPINTTSAVEASSTSETDGESPTPQDLPTPDFFATGNRDGDRDHAVSSLDAAFSAARFLARSSHVGRGSVNSAAVAKHGTMPAALNASGALEDGLEGSKNSFASAVDQILADESAEDDILQY